MPIITLTTDIGQHDFMIGAIKGQLLTCNPAFTICDITHHLSQSNYPQAAYVCSNAFKHYPQQAFHIIILNLFELPPKQLLIAKYNDHYIACPDNGILTMIAGEKPKQIITLAIANCKTLLDFTALVAQAAKRILNLSLIHI